MTAYGQTIHLMPKCLLIKEKLRCEIKNTTQLQLNCTLYSRIASKSGDQMNTVNDVYLIEQETQVILSDHVNHSQYTGYVSADVFCKIF